jgi:transposase
VGITAAALRVDGTQLAHCYDTGGMKRSHLCGHKNILNWRLIRVGEFNLSMMLRQLTGAGTLRE